MRIGIDIDGVLADFNESFIRRTVTVTNRDMFPPRPFDIPIWDYPQHYGYTEAEVSAVWKTIVEDSMFWAYLTPYPTTKPFLQKLNPEKDDLYFITSRPGIIAKQQTEAWIRYYGGPVSPTVLISSMKGECARALDLEAYIDDRDKNVLNVRAYSSTTRVYILDQPWNREETVYDWKGIVRVTSPLDMLTDLGL
jgi:uncharacterized HAD superfamily protein